MKYLLVGVPRNSNNYIFGFTNENSSWYLLPTGKLMRFDYRFEGDILL